MNKSFPVDVPAPEIRTREALSVVQLGVRCSFEDTSAIPPLWQSFNEREAEISSIAGRTAYGVCCDVDQAGRFRYLAGVDTRPGAGLPQGMKAVSVPASRCAVFVHSGHAADLPKTVHAIWNRALPDVG